MSHAPSSAALLRQLRGWSIEEAAAKLVISREEILAAEGGRDRERQGLLLRKMGIDEGAWEESGVIGPDLLGEAREFHFQGPLSSFSQRDLEPKCRALSLAREWIRHDPVGTRGAELRLTLGPEPMSSRPIPAQHGHLLARRLRLELGLGAEPLLDPARLCEERLGVRVWSWRFASAELSALALLDQDRATAVIALNEGDQKRRQHPALLRVHVAHELCHILFDPPVAGIYLALDLSAAPQQSRSCATTLQEALEKRARGFAAELLLPAEGLQELIGTEIPTSGREASSLVERACVRFGAPREICAWHMQNLGILTSELREEVVRARRGALSPNPPSPQSLPSTREAPRPAAELWERAIRVNRQRLQTEQRRARELLEQLRLARSEGRSIAALAVDLMEWVDMQAEEGRWQALNALAELYDPGEWSPSITNGLLTITSSLHEQMPARPALMQRCRAALSETWSWDAERVEHLMRRVAG